MKKLITIFALISLASPLAMADHHEGEGKIQERKAKALSRIDKKISYMNELKTCVNSASKKGDIKKCRETHKGKMKAFREEKKAMRKMKKK